jgi:hypothetical protein
MTNLQDPPRMFDDSEVPPELRQWLTAARDDCISADAVERIAAATLARIPGPQGGGTPSGTATPGHGALGGAAAGKIAVGIGVLLLAAGGLWLASLSGHRAATTQASVPSASAVPEPASAAVAASGSSALALESAAGTTSAVPAEGAFPPGSGVRTSASPARVPATEATPSGRAPATADSAGLASLMEEHRILRLARQVLPADPQRALALTQEHARRFPGGTLAQEREVIAIDALARLGRAKDARDRAQGFRESYPDSPHRDQVDSTTKSTGPKAPGQ